HKEGNAFAQSVDYRYNIRGWLKRINNSDLSPDAGDHKDDLFGMELSYNEGFEVPQYNGNISGARWKNAVDNTERAYGYTYDPMNRLTGADYVAGGPGGWTKEEERFEVGNIGYDHNGNILALDRNGLFRHTMGEAPEYGITDQLSYHYKGNQRSEEHTSELQSRENLVCRLLLEKKKHYRHATLSHERQLDS